MPSCAVKWCISQSHVHKKEDGISFHIFPQDENRRRIWTEAVRLERQDCKWMPSKNRKICSIHFKGEDFYLTRKGNLKLKSSAVPICTMVFANIEPAKPMPSTTTFQTRVTSGTVNYGILVPSLYLAVPSNIHTNLTIKKEDIIDERDIKNEPSWDRETDYTKVTVNTECDDETYKLGIEDPLPDRSVRLPKTSSSTPPTKNRLQLPSSSTQPPKKRLRSLHIEDPLLKPCHESSFCLPKATSSTQPTKKCSRSPSSTEEDDLVDINQRLLAIEESRIDADMELARAMNRQASALEELVGLARTFVNIYERNNRQNDNSTNNEQQSMEQCQTSNQQDPEVLESIFLHIKKELPE